MSILINEKKIWTPENSFLLEYRAKAEAGEIIIGQELWIELDNLAEDFKDDRFFYDTADALLRMDFMEHCVRLTKSPYYNKPMVLMLWQKALIECFYSFKMAKESRDQGQTIDRFKKLLLLIARKNTKALALDTRIPTPTGDKTIADIQEGDYVFGVDGKPVKVITTSEIFKNRKCYKLTFEDGEEIICDENHKWTVQTKCSRKRLRYVSKSGRKSRCKHPIDEKGNITVQTFEMVHDYMRPRADGKGIEYKYRVPIPEPVEYPKKDLPLDPYVLGVWLGDGDKNDNRIAVGVEDLDTLISEMKKRNINIQSVKIFSGKYEVRIGQTISYHRHDVREALRALNVWKNKHIPEEYLTASIEQRKELLKGLMDTDGTATKAGQCLFTQKSKVLTNGFSKLLSSLGIKHTIKLDDVRCGDVFCKAYKVQFWTDKTDPCFHYQRKINRLKKHLAPRMDYKTIIGIEEVAPRDTKCITVDREDGLFLCGQRNTVTHNSELSSAIALSEVVCGNEGADIVASSNDDAQASIVYDSIDTMRTLIDPSDKDTKRNQRFIMNKETNTKVFKLSDRTKNKEGRNIDFAILDECHEMSDSVIAKSIEQSQSLKDNPKFINITTEGFVFDGYLDGELKKARAIINQEEPDNPAHIRMLPWLYTQDSELEVWEGNRDNRLWMKSNPTLGTVKKWEYMEEQVELARASKADKLFVLSKDFNIKQSKSEAWLSSDAFSYDSSFDIETLRGAKCIGAVDLSETTDLTCAKVMIMRPDDPFKYIITKYFIPESKLEDSDDKHAGAKYEEWAKDGYLTITEGNDIDLAFVADWFYSLYTDYNIRLWRCGYDQRFAKDWIKQMESYGWMKTGGDDSDLVMIPQNAVTLSNAIKLCEADFKHQFVKYGNNDMDQWCLRNAGLKVDEKGLALIVKMETAKRIDGAVCLAILYEMYRRNRTELRAIIGG